MFTHGVQSKRVLSIKIFAYCFLATSCFIQTMDQTLLGYIKQKETAINQNVSDAAFLVASTLVDEDSALQNKPYKRLKVSFQCDVCFKSYMHNRSLRRHRRIHTGKQPGKQHRCDICNKTFNQKSYLQQHLVSHTGEKQYKCDQCKFESFHRSSLWRHNKTCLEKKLVAKKDIGILYNNTSINT